MAFTLDMTGTNSSWLAKETASSSKTFTKTLETADTYLDRNIELSITSQDATVSHSLTGNSSFTPTISKQSTPTGVTNAASGDATTTQPSSGVYVAIKSATQTAKTNTATYSITRAGWITNSSNWSTSNTVSLNASATTYVPIITTSVSFGGGAASASISSNTITVAGMVTSADSTSYYIDAAASGSYSTTAFTYTNNAGWLTAHSGTSAKSAQSGNISKSATRVYIQAAAATITGSGTATSPTIAKGGSGEYNGSYGNITTTKPTSGYYVGVKATAPATTITMTTNIDTEGYLSASSQITASGSIGAKAGSMYYVPVTSGAVTVSGSTVATSPTIAADTHSGTFGAVTATQPSSGYYAAVKATAPATTISLTKTVDTAGYLGAASQITASASTTAKTGSTYYVPVATAAATVTGSGTATSPTIAVGTHSGTFGTLTTTKPSSGYYVTVVPTAPATTVTMTKSVGTTGYLAGTGQITASGSISAKTGSTYYVPVATAAATVTGSGTASSPTIAVGTHSGSHGTITTTKPSSGYYTTVVATAPATTVTMTKSVGTKGYLNGTGQITASGTISAKTGSTYYVPITSGSAKTPATSIAQSTPTFSWSGRTVTASVAAKTQSVTPTVTAGYVASGTAGTITLTASSGTNSISNFNSSATTYTPSLSAQTVVSAGNRYYFPYAVTVAAIPAKWTYDYSTAKQMSNSGTNRTFTHTVTGATSYPHCYLAMSSLAIDTGNTTLNIRQVVIFPITSGNAQVFHTYLTPIDKILRQAMTTTCANWTDSNYYGGYTSSTSWKNCTLYGPMMSTSQSYMLLVQGKQ